jgi:hypothetical protein
MSLKYLAHLLGVVDVNGRSNKLSRFASAMETGVEMFGGQPGHVLKSNPTAVRHEQHDTAAPGKDCYEAVDFRATVYAIFTGLLRKQTGPTLFGSGDSRSKVRDLLNAFCCWPFGGQPEQKGTWGLSVDGVDVFVDNGSVCLGSTKESFKLTFPHIRKGYRGECRVARLGEISANSQAS